MSERGAYASRGGLKLEHALRESGLSVAGRSALDVGASTGGFTDCLLAHGARAVVAVDVGYGQLDWRLRNDPRVHVLERLNARELAPELLPFAPDLAVIDVSFISIAKVLPAVLRCLRPAHDVLALVKPQFEVGRERVGKGGVVRVPEHRADALAAVGEAAIALGEAVVGFYDAGLPGPKGNREAFVWLTGGERPEGSQRPEGSEQAWTREQAGGAATAPARAATRDPARVRELAAQAVGRVP
jgi:23S rRNA (cytidine1920-2'-O)/16S rRNA (cytidine1409-2'-O)-methyltransferase